MLLILSCLLLRTCKKVANYSTVYLTSLIVSIVLSHSLSAFISVCASLKAEITGMFIASSFPVLLVSVGYSDYIYVVLSEAVRVFGTSEMCNNI